MTPVDVDDLAQSLAVRLDGAVSDLRRLSGGASRETWAFTLDGRPLILQRQRAGSVQTGGGMISEAALLRAAAVAGVPVPAVVEDGSAGDGDDLLSTPFLVVELLPGETIPRKLLRDEEFAAIRPTLAAACGRILAGVHSVPPSTAPALERQDQVEQFRGVLDMLGEPHPAFELGFRWLEANRPDPGDAVVVHGDFRNGNLLVTADAITAVLDWELAHLGDPLEDLGWLCVRAWRFGSPLPVGGFGEREELYTAYEDSGGRPVDRDAVRWWEALGTLKWGVMCMVQAASHRGGMSRSVELAAIGRRTCENEHDLLALLPGGPMPPATDIATIARGSDEPHDLPTVSELVEAVREYVEGDVMSATDGRVRFHARVATNVLGMVERQLAMGAAHRAAHQARLASLGVDGDAELADAIRAGSMDDRWEEVRAAVWASVRDKLAVANPGYED